MTGFRAALGFLTRLPVGRVSAAGFPAGWLPLVGVVVAAVGLAGWLVTDRLLGPGAAAVAAVLATVAVTGALHEDGLADTADGLWGGGTPQRRLEIMRDSRLGTYGAVALAGDLLLRVALLLPLAPADVARVLVAGHVLGRAAPLLLVAGLPPAQPDGYGARFGSGRWQLAGAGATVLVVAVATTRWWAPLLLVAAAIPVAALRRAGRRRLGGYTGDLLGATVLGSNLAVAATVAALARAGWL